MATSAMENNIFRFSLFQYRYQELQPPGLSQVGLATKLPLLYLRPNSQIPYKQNHLFSLGGGGSFKIVKSIHRILPEVPLPS